MHGIVYVTVVPKEAIIDLRKDTKNTIAYVHVCIWTCVWHVHLYIHLYTMYTYIVHLTPTLDTMYMSPNALM